MLKGNEIVISLFIFKTGVENSKTRGHNFKVRRKKFKRDLSGNFITASAVVVQNELQKEVTEEDMITMFQRHLDMELDSNGVEGYVSNVGKWDYNNQVGMDDLSERVKLLCCTTL